MSKIKVRVTDLIRKGEITIAPIPYPLKANAAVWLTEEDYNSIYIQVAIEKGYLVRESPAPEPNLEPEAKVKPVKIKSKKEKPKKEEVEEVDPEVKAKLDKEKNNKVNMKSWDLEKQKLMDKENSKKLTLDQINSKDMTKVKTGDIDFTKDESDLVQTVNKMLKGKGKAGKKIIGKKTASTAKGRALTPVGTKRVSPSGNDPGNFVYANEGESLGFVDGEQEFERVSNHPVLSKLAKQNEEVL